MQLAIVLIIFILLLAGLYSLQKKHVSFSKRVFIALFIGVLFGLGIHQLNPKSTAFITGLDWINLVGSSYVKFLSMIVLPLVFISILTAFTRLKATKNIGRIAALVLALLVGTTVIGAAIGVGSSYVFHVDGAKLQKGAAETARGTLLDQKMGDLSKMTLPGKISELLPSNPVADLSGSRSTSTIATVIFAAFVGVAFLGVKKKQPEEAETFRKIIEAFHAIILRIVTIVLRLTPYGILAIITKATASTDFGAIVNLGTFVVSSYVALIIMFGVHLLLITVNGLNPVTYIKKSLPVLTFAFTSRTSAGALPINIKTQTEGLGVSEGIANVAGPFSLSIGQNACAGIYPAMVAVIAASASGINPFTPSFIISLLAVIAISSFGVAGVGGGATFATLLVLSTMNLPVALAGLLISVEPLIDMGRTAVNVSGSLTTGILTSKWQGEFDSEIYKKEVSFDRNDQMSA